MMANFHCLLKAAVACLALGLAHATWADPPGRVGRVSFIDGTVSFKTAADPQWTQATLNFPVTAGAAILTDASSLAEIQIGSSALRMDQATKLEFAELDDHTIQIFLGQGTVAVRLRNLDREESFKVITLDGVTVSLLSAGRYRVDSARPNQPMRVTAFEGSVQIANDSSAVIVSQGKTAIVLGGTGLIRHEIREAIPVAFDDWAQSRDYGGAADKSPQYVSQEMTGSQELSSNGQWSTDPEYGPVWSPYGMPADWSPYQYGHWSWVEPWGWTWIDHAPWGFAPFHYGRWAFINSSWRWAPGLFIVHPVFAPALVTFIRSPHFFVSFGSSPLVGWFPLAPGQVFVPAFPCSTVFLQKLNLPITSRLVTINAQNVNLTQITLINGRFPPGVMVIPQSAFVKTLTVSKSKIQLPVNAPSPALRVSSVPFGQASPPSLSASVNSAHSLTSRSMLAAANPPMLSRVASAKQTLLNSNEWSRQNRVSVGMPVTPQNPAPTLSQVRNNAMRSPATFSAPSTWDSNRIVTHVHAQSAPVATPDHTRTTTPQAHPRTMPVQSAVMEHSASEAEHKRGLSREVTQHSVVTQPFSQPVRRGSGFSSFRSPG